MYTRISDDRQGRQLGVIRQREDCQALAERLGVTDVVVYEDNDISASKGKLRANYERMLAAVEAGEVQAVLAYHPYRLVRRMTELERLIDVIERAGLVVQTVAAGPFDLSTPAGRMVARIMGATAQHEAELIGERVRRKQVELARAGKMGGRGRRAFGYNADRSAIVEHEAELIREAADRFLAGESSGSICRDWNARGIRTAGTKANPEGSVWRTNGLTGMMVGPHLAALRVHDPGGGANARRRTVVGPATWPAILDEATHRRLVAILNDPSRVVVRGKRVALLSGGLARCGRCGHNLRTGTRGSERGAGRRIYVCARVPGHDGCGRLSVQAVAVEDQVRDMVIVALAGPGLARALNDYAADDSEAARLSESLGADEARLDECRTALADGDLDLSSFNAVRRRLETRLDATRRALAGRTGRPALRGLPSSEEGLRDAWKAHEDDVAWRRALVGAVIDYVTVAPVLVPGLNRFDPARLAPPYGPVWRA